MVQITTIETKSGKVSFLFGMRALAVFSRIAGTNTMKEFAARMTDPGFDDISTLLFAGHENYCKKQKKDLMYADHDEMFDLLDEIGIEKAVDVMGEGVSQIYGEVTGKKKAVKKT